MSAAGFTSSKVSRQSPPARFLASLESLSLRPSGTPSSLYSALSGFSWVTDDLGPVGLADNRTADLLRRDVDDVANQPVVPRLAERDLAGGEPRLLFLAAPEIGAASAFPEQIGVEPADDAGRHRLAGAILDLEADGLRFLDVGLFHLEPLVTRRVAGLGLEQLELRKCDQRGFHLVEMDRILPPGPSCPSRFPVLTIEKVACVRLDNHLGGVVDALGQDSRRRFSSPLVSVVRAPAG